MLVHIPHEITWHHLWGAPGSPGSPGLPWGPLCRSTPPGTWWVGDGQQTAQTTQREACGDSSSRLSGEWGETEAPGPGRAERGSGVGEGRAEGLTHPPPTAVSQAAGQGARAHPHLGSQAVCLSVWGTVHHQNTLTEAVPSSWVLCGGRLALVYQSALAV